MYGGIEGMDENKFEKLEDELFQKYLDRKCEMAKLSPDERIQYLIDETKSLQMYLIWTMKRFDMI
jgi:hypothetical protein